MEYFRPSINSNSWSDRFSSAWTFLLLLVLALVTGLRHHVGPNVICKTPQEFDTQSKAFADQLCWIANQKVVYGKNEIEILPTISWKHHGHTTRTLYQWLPLILVLQALLFRLPDVILRICESTFGFGCQNLIGLVNGYNKMSATDKMSMADDISKYLYQRFNDRVLKSIPFGIVTIIVAFVKLLFFINAVTQLAVLEGYLSPPDVASYGQHVLESIINTHNSSNVVSPAFPREILCDFVFYRLSIVQMYTSQCLIPVNEFNEQVCFFLWIWLLFVCVAAGTSGAIFFVKSVLPFIRQSYVEKYLKMADIKATSQEISSFSGTTIGQDGVMILQMIGEISSDVLVRDIIVNIWNIHRNRGPGGYVFSEEPNTTATAPELFEMKKC